MEMPRPYKKGVFMRELLVRELLVITRTNTIHHGSVAIHCVSKFDLHQVTVLRLLLLLYIVDFFSLKSQH